MRYTVILNILLLFCMLITTSIVYANSNVSVDTTIQNNTSISYMENEGVKEDSSSQQQPYEKDIRFEIAKLIDKILILAIASMTFGIPLLILFGVIIIEAHINFW